MLPAEPLNQDQISSLLGIILEVVTPAGVVEGDWLLAGDQVDHHGCVKVVKGLQSLQVEACDLLKLNAALLPPLSLPNLCVAAGTALSSTPVPVRLILDSSIDLTPYRGKNLEVKRSSGIVEGGWRLAPGAHTDAKGKVQMVMGD